MTDYPVAIPLLAIQRLRCPKCRTRLQDSSFARCSKCGHVEKIVIASDPMKSGVVGWFAGELQPPT